MPTSVQRRQYSARQPREVRREQFLDAALRLVARDGWAAMTMDRVSSEADVAKSVAYAIFESQAGLQHALMAREQQRGYAAAADCVAAMAACAGDPGAAIRAGLRTFLASVAAAPDSWRLIVLPIAGAPESVREAVAVGRERWRRELEPLVTSVLERQGIAGLDVEIVAHLLRGNAEYLARLMLEDPGRFPAQRLQAFGDELVAIALTR